MPKEENVINKMQPMAGFFESEVQDVLCKESHEQVGIGGGHSCTQGSSLNLGVMFEVKREMVVGEDKLGKLVKELSEW